MIINKFALALVLGAFFTGIFLLIYKIKFRKAHKKAIENNQLPEKKHVFFESVGGFFPVIAFVLIFRSFIFEPFQIPSGSMMRTLLVGDFLLVNKFNYGIKNPVTNGSWIELNSPKRGDVVVFKAPGRDNVDYIKRVIGLPGERVIYDKTTKEVQIYPACYVTTETCKPLEVTYSAPIKSDFFDVSNRNDLILPLEKGASDPAGIAGNRLLERTETIDGHSHTILINPVKSDKVLGYASNSRLVNNNKAEFIIPEDSYFVMGDNRDNSEDGRFFGPVHKDLLVGNAVFIWISFERLPGEWPTGIRFSRIGTIE
ncbi:signal peptidase I [Thorsellia kenyensis]|uniref:Signal peptidase I n=1 Tax=Thorsellia kenyensis TaxID=1549888 RepID=A0ABV6CA99_9GAMM